MAFTAFITNIDQYICLKQWRIHVGVHGGRDPPFEFPIFSICTKRPFCRFLNFFSTPNIKEVMPVFAPKSAILHHYFQKFSGWNKCTQSAGKCTISHEDFKNFPGVTPPYPLWGRAQAPCIFGPSALKKPPSGFVGPPLSKVAGSAPDFEGRCL